MPGTVLITGAARGLGFALAESFLTAGFDVFAAHRTPVCPTLNQLAKRHPGKLTALPMDVLQPTSIQSALERVTGLAPQLDVLINNAALCLDIDDPIDRVDFELIQQQIDVNVYGPLRVTQAFLPLLEKSDRGVLVNISSEAGSVGKCWRGTGFGYGMSKAALNMQSRILEKYLAPKGIKVFAIHPGWMRTDMGGSNADIAPDEAAQGILRIATSQSYRDASMYLVYNGDTYPY
jgi:NAD(P)-dependent dehydrogenase (short-subunit alcohol dehydrogenase family)